MHPHVGPPGDGHVAVSNIPLTVPGIWHAHAWRRAVAERYHITSFTVVQIGPVLLDELPYAGSPSPWLLRWPRPRRVAIPGPLSRSTAPELGVSAGPISVINSSRPRPSRISSPHGAECGSCQTGVGIPRPTGRNYPDPADSPGLHRSVSSLRQSFPNDRGGSTTYGQPCFAKRTALLKGSVQRQLLDL